MPFIHIKSLPPGTDTDVERALERLSQDFARDLGIDIEQVTATWEFFPAGHCAVGGSTARQPSDRSSLLIVDLLVPDFNTGANVEKMLTSIAATIEKHAGTANKHVFINCRQAHSGRVYDAGEIVTW